MKVLLKTFRLLVRLLLFGFSIAALLELAEVIRLQQMREVRGLISTPKKQSLLQLLETIPFSRFPFQGPIEPPPPAAAAPASHRLLLLLVQRRRRRRHGQDQRQPGLDAAVLQAPPSPSPSQAPSASSAVAHTHRGCQASTKHNIAEENRRRKY